MAFHLSDAHSHGVGSFLPLSVGNFFVDVISYFSINYIKSKEIGLFISIRKGFLLALILHVMVTKALGYLYKVSQVLIKFIHFLKVNVY